MTTRRTMLEVARSREPSIHNLERLLHIDNLRFLHSMILLFFAHRSLIRSCGRMPALHRPRALAPLLSLRSLRPIFTILPTLKKPRRRPCSLFLQRTQILELHPLFYLLHFPCPLIHHPSDHIPSQSSLVQP